MEKKKYGFLQNNNEEQRCYGFSHNRRGRRKES